MASEDYQQTELDKIDYVRWTIVCRAMHCRIVKGEANGAVRMLEQFCKQPFRIKATLESPLSAVFPERIASTLYALGLVDLRSLKSVSDARLMAVPNFGLTFTREVRDVYDRVVAGDMIESYGVDESLIDEELCWQPPKVEQVDKRSILSQVATSVAQPKEEIVKMPSNQEQVLAALDVLVKSPDTAREALEQAILKHQVAIEDHKSEIARLRKLQSSLHLRSEKEKPSRESSLGAAPAKGYQKKDWTETIERMIAAIKASGPMKPVEMAGKLGLTPAQVGMAVRHSPLLARDALGRVFIKAKAAS